MSKGRMEAFSDGVLAIIITIMVLELKVPHGAGLAELGQIAPVFLSYVLSFIYVGIYWNNHHHLLQSVHKVNGKVLWANLHLLFWLSLLPFVTGWMGENHFATVPAALYGAVLLMCALAFVVLSRILIGIEGEGSALAIAINRDYKGWASVALYLLALVLVFVNNWLAVAIYGIVAALWFIPDQRIEKRLESSVPE